MKFISRDTSTFFRKNPSTFYQGAILSYIFFLIGAFEIGLFILFLKGTFDFTDTLPMRVLISLSGLIPISASLGAYEGASVLAFTNFKLGAEIGLAYSLIRRLIDLIVVFIGISFAFRYFTGFCLKNRKF